MTLFHDPAFLESVTAIAGFATVLVGAIRWLMKIAYKYRLDADQKQHSFQMDLIRALDAQVKEIRPIVELHSKVVEEHTKLINKFQGTAQQIFESEGRITRQVDDLSQIQKEMKIQFTNASADAQVLRNTLSCFSSDLEKIKTEILTLKKGSGNVFVTTKKE